jgi:cephalosporin-C deacetylase
MPNGPAVAATMPDVPFLANFARAIQITDSKPYGEVIEYLSVRPEEIGAVLATLSYIDVVNHARRIHVPALFSVGLIDDLTPASTVFSAYNHYAGPKHIEIYPFNSHEGGGTHQFHAKLDFLARLT